MKNVLIKGLLAGSLLASGLSADIYVGAKYGVMNFGGSGVYTPDGGSDHDIEEDTTDAPLTLRVGYITDTDNRIGLYYKTDTVAFDVDNWSDFTANTFGLNGEIGFSSLKTEIAGGELLPFIGLGLGIGSGEVDGSSEDLTVVEFDLSVGVNYKIESFEITADLYRRAIAFADDNDNALAYAINGIALGVNYRF